jgi:hypothetical protein
MILIRTSPQVRSKSISPLFIRIFIIDKYTNLCYTCGSSFCTERLPYGSRAIFILCKMYKEKVLLKNIVRYENIN